MRSQITSLLATLTIVAACSDPARVVGDDDVTAAADVGFDALDAAPIVDRPLDVSRDASSEISTDGVALDANRNDAGDDGAVCHGASADPDPTLTTPGEYTDPSGCMSPPCPGAFQGFMLTPNAANTVAAVSGTASGSLTCTFAVVSASCGVEQGTLSIDPDSRAFSGSVPLFCGVNVVRVICASGSNRRIRVVRVMGRECAGDDLRLTLTWDRSVVDGELHLIRAPGHINDPVNDCTWTTCIAPRVLDWGAPGDRATEPVKDVDNVTTEGTEHITLTRAPAGTYHVLSEHWNPGGATGAMQMQINVQGRTPIVRSVPAIAAHWVWYVGDVVFPGGTFTPIDASVAGHTGPLTDCTAMWTSPGCGMAIPQ